MKKTILTSILLASFAIAIGETNTETQAIVEKVSTALQDLGRGYAKDARSNQIYYDGKLVNVYSPKTFTIINKENENAYDAEDYYFYYQEGKADDRDQDWDVDYAQAKVELHNGPYRTVFDYNLNIPAKCFDDKDVPPDLLRCYQKYMPFNIWSEGTPLNPDTFQALGLYAGWTGKVFVTDGHRLIALTIAWSLENREFENFSINNIDDFSTFEFIGEQRDKPMLASRSQSQANSLDSNRKNMAWKDLLPWTESMALKLYYFKDKKYVYANNIGVIEGADAESFELLTFPYAKDKNHIFYYGKILKEANRDTFEILDYRLKIARDEANIFYKDHQLKELDAKTFKLINTPYPSLAETCEDSSYEGRCPIALLMDNKSIYYVDLLLSDEPEYSVLMSASIKHMSINENKSQPERLYGMVSLPLLLKDGKDVEILRTGTGNCMVRSTMGVKSHNSLFVIGRVKDSLYVLDMVELDLEGI